MNMWENFGKSLNFGKNKRKVMSYPIKKNRKDSTAPNFWNLWQWWRL